MQLLGAWAMIASLLLLARSLQTGPAAPLASLAAACGIAGIATAAALQAVDGVALKAMVDRWAAAAGPERQAYFAAAYWVRQVEIGLAGINCLLLGLMAGSLGLALMIGRSVPGWIGAMGLAAGAATAASGVVICYAGFSEPAMATNMLALLLLMAWVLVLAWAGWRRGLQ